MVKVSKSNFSFIAISSVRYALGRLSYAPNATVSILMDHIADLDDNTLFVLTRDIREHLSGTTYEGMFSDIGDDWTNLLLALCDEQKRRDVVDNSLVYYSTSHHRA